MEWKNPSPTVDVVLELDGEVLLIERLNPPHGWALPGGFVDEGESVESAAVREVLEETGLRVELDELLYVYSNPERDKRQHNISVVFTASSASGEMLGGDDAKQARLFPLDALPPLVFDHEQILKDYVEFRATGRRPSPRIGR